MPPTMPRSGPCDRWWWRARTGVGIELRKELVHRRSALTALGSNEHLGWAEIRHPFHPLRGQRFPVYKACCIGGVAALRLGGPEGGNFIVPREWTDWAAPSFRDSLGSAPRRLEANSLLELAALVELLRSEEHTSELQSRRDLVCRLLLEKKKKK